MWNSIEILGLIATLFVLVSFLFKEQKITRCINIVGCIFFVIYGLLLNAWSVWLLNGTLIFIHIYFLIPKNSSKN